MGRRDARRRIGASMTALNFDRPPPPSLLAVARKRGRKLGSGESIPRIEATARILEGGVAEYARVCGFAATDPLPPTWPNVLLRGLQFAVLTHDAFPLGFAGVVHVAQRIEVIRPLRRHEAMAGRVWVEGHRPARRGGEYDVHSAVSVAGEDAWRAVTTILSRELPGDGEKRVPPQPLSFGHSRSVDWRVPADQGRRYAAVSGDYNPIHLSAWTARPFGFKRPIAHGWWTLARALAELDTDLPASCVIEARFVSPLSLPGTVFFESGPIAGGMGFVVRAAPKQGSRREGAPRRESDGRILEGTVRGR